MEITLSSGQTLDRLPSDAATAALVTSIGGSAYLQGYAHPLAALTAIGGYDIADAPCIANIHSAVYAAASAPGALDMSAWHCGTSHCRAGWVVTLAGEAGAALEAKIGETNRERQTPIAATLIYLRSAPGIIADGFPDFYLNDNEAVLADMKRLSDEETLRAATAGSGSGSK